MSQKQFVSSDEGPDTACHTSAGNKESAVAHSGEQFATTARAPMKLSRPARSVQFDKYEYVNEFDTRRPPAEASTLTKIVTRAAKLAQDVKRSFTGRTLLKLMTGVAAERPQSIMPSITRIRKPNGSSSRRSSCSATSTAAMNERKPLKHTPHRGPTRWQRYPSVI